MNTKKKPLSGAAESDTQCLRDEVGGEGISAGIGIPPALHPNVNSELSSTVEASNPSEAK